MPGGFLLGAQSRYGRSGLGGAARGVQVDLPWSVALRVFGPLLADLADGTAAVAELPGGRTMVDQIDGAADSVAVDRVGTWLYRQIEVHPEPPPMVVRALERIEVGVTGVGDLADELGCSRGHLHRAVRAATGQSPSTLIRVTRIHRLMALAASNRVATIADQAARAGYADHAHLCHDVRWLAGRTPSELLGRG
jgi:AraC-like DNA-binding protein